MVTRRWLIRALCFWVLTAPGIVLLYSCAAPVEPPVEGAVR